MALLINDLAIKIIKKLPKVFLKTAKSRKLIHFDLKYEGNAVIRDENHFFD